ncbi:MAG: Zn-finger in Ran binding protein and other [candidate division WS6 bacterium 36_33]|uniref:Zn-finger in Ran binding protein and other n=1 Tax=candidate division WS6 bacterium 36_33 TaxID=1641388 RepID=A0A101GZ93_9BACT|nr:MAG: Zn-finger in Ran binding protein and other [candidate division WS6 bacterium 36_33]
MEVTRLGAWDCRYCDTKRILGNIYDCPGCGHPRHRGVHFYQISDGPVVTPEIQRQLGSGGPNWYCEHCDSGNRDTDTKCMDCGAPKGSSPSHEVKTYQGKGSGPKSTEEAEALDPDGESWETDVILDQYSPIDTTEEAETNHDGESWKTNLILSQYEEMHTNPPDDFPSKSRSTTTNRQPFAWKKYGLIALAVVVFLSFLFLGYQLIFNKHEESVTVEQFSWQQSVVLEEYTAVRESSWSSHPIDAYDIDVDYRDTGRDKRVSDGWTTETYMDTCSRSVYVSKTCYETVDNGNGSFTSRSYECGSTETEYYSCQQTRQVELYHYEDIWDNYYTYTIDKWVFVEEYPTSGRDHIPFYAEVEIVNSYVSSIPILGQQRTIEVPGKYQIQFKSDNEKIGEEGYFERDYPYTEWIQFSEDEVYTITVNTFNHILNKPEP